MNKLSPWRVSISWSWEMLSFPHDPVAYFLVTKHNGFFLIKPLRADKGGHGFCNAFPVSVKDYFFTRKFRKQEFLKIKPGYPAVCQPLVFHNAKLALICLIGFMALPFGAFFINVSIVSSALITRVSTGKDFL